MTGQLTLTCITRFLVKPICSKHWNQRHRKTNPVLWSTTVFNKMHKWIQRHSHVINNGVNKTKSQQYIHISYGESPVNTGCSALRTFYKSSSNTKFSNQTSECVGEMLPLSPVCICWQLYWSTDSLTMHFSMNSNIPTIVWMITTVGDNCSLLQVSRQKVGICACLDFVRYACV